VPDIHRLPDERVGLGGLLGDGVYGPTEAVEAEAVEAVEAEAGSAIAPPPHLLEYDPHRQL
jgi:hypothetical protein